MVLRNFLEKNWIFSGFFLILASLIQFWPELGQGWEFEKSVIGFDFGLKNFFQFGSIFCHALLSITRLLNSLVLAGKFFKSSHLFVPRFFGNMVNFFGHIFYVNILTYIFWYHDFFFSRFFSSPQCKIICKHAYHFGKFSSSSYVGGHLHMSLC